MSNSNGGSYSSRVYIILATFGSEAHVLKEVESLEIPGLDDRCLSNRVPGTPGTPNNQKQIVIPMWQLRSFTEDIAVWGNIHLFLVV